MSSRRTKCALEEIIEQLRTTSSTNTSIQYCASPEVHDINYMARDLRCDADFLAISDQDTETHASFASFVRGLQASTRFALEVPFGNVEREPQMPQAAPERLLHQRSGPFGYLRPSPHRRQVLNLDPPPVRGPRQADGLDWQRLVKQLFFATRCVA